VDRGEGIAVHDVGDIVWVEFDPVLGSEQAKRRPALVLTAESYHQRSPRAIVCPISSVPHIWPFNVSLPEGLKTKGAVLVDQVRTIDRAERMFRTIERAPMDVVTAVRTNLAVLVGIDASIFSGN
jgi:mRNA interferase MazF